MSKQNAIRFAAEQLLDEKRRTIDYQKVIDLITNADINRQRRILSSIKSKHSSNLGKIIIDMVFDDFKSQARSEAQAMLADDTLSIDEINKVFKNI